MSYGNGGVGGATQATNQRGRALDDVQSRARALVERLESAQQRTYDVASRFTGAFPVGNASPGAPDKVVGVVPELREMLARAHAVMESLEQSLARLEEV